MNVLTICFIDSKDAVIAANRIKHSIEYLPKCPTCKINTLVFIGKLSKYGMMNKNCEIAYNDSYFLFYKTKNKKKN